MEEEPALGNWIKLEVEAEAERVRASLIRRVLSVRDHPMPNLTEASAYLALCFPLPPISPAPHAGHRTFTLARAHAPAHLGLLGPSWDPSDAMDCSEDGQCGMDGMGDPPSSPLYMLFTHDGSVARPGSRDHGGCSNFAVGGGISNFPDPVKPGVYGY